MTLKLKLQLAVSVAVLATSAVLVRYAVAVVRDQAAAEATRIRAEKTAEVKRDLADKVNTVYALVDAQYHEAADELYLQQKYGRRLKAIVDVATATLRAQSERARRGEVPRERAQRDALATLRAMRFDGGKGYLWINDVGRPFPRMIMHPVLPALEGKVLDSPEFKGGDRGRNFFQLAVELTAASGDGFIRYRWPEPDGSVLLSQMDKFSYVRLFEEWGWVLGTGIYIDEAVREKLGEVTSAIRTIRYGSEYFWINTAESPVPRMVMHPIRPELDGATLGAAEFEIDVNGKHQNLFSAFRDIAQQGGEGFVQYSWPKPMPSGPPGPPAPKLSFVKLYPPLGWIVGTGRYVDDIEGAIAEKTRAGEAQVASLVRRIVLASLVVVVLAVAGVTIFAGSLTRPLAKLVGLSREIAEDEQHLSRRIGLASKDEIGQLAREFDHMAERVETSFRRVREEREILRSVLSNIPHGIYWKDRRSVYLGCNDRFAHRFGLASPEAIVGKSDEQLGWSDELRGPSAGRDRQVIESGEPLLDRREILRDASGREVCCLASRVPLRDPAGNLIGMLGVFVAVPGAPCDDERSSADAA